MSDFELVFLDTGIVCRLARYDQESLVHLFKVSRFVGGHAGRQDLSVVSAFQMSSSYTRIDCGRYFDEKNKIVTSTFRVAPRNNPSFCPSLSGHQAATGSARGG